MRHADPFTALQGVSVPAAAPPAAVQTPNLMELGDLMGTDSPAAQAPPSQSSPFGLGTSQPQSLLYGGQMGQVPTAAAQAPAPSQQQPTAAPAAGGPAPMAPRGNAAVEQQAGRKDPFADLFS